MKFEDIEKIKLGQAFQCKGCHKRLAQGIDKIHWMSEPVVTGPGIELEAFPNDHYPVCEECHNRMFGEDPFQISDKTLTFSLSENFGLSPIIQGL